MHLFTNNVIITTKKSNCGDNMGFTEADWKLFRSKTAVWQENYIDKLNKEYIDILSCNSDPSEKFWKLEKRINNDKKHPGVVIQVRRSTMLYDMATLLRDSVITKTDLEEFSDELKQSIDVIMK